MTGDPQEYNRFTHPFDQTGGLVDLEGESDGSAEGEFHSRATEGQTDDDGTLRPSAAAWATADWRSRRLAESQTG